MAIETFFFFLLLTLEAIGILHICGVRAIPVYDILWKERFKKKKVEFTDK